MIGDGNNIPLSLRHLTWLTLRGRRPAETLANRLLTRQSHTVTV
jgi:hypothetical protein